MKKGKHIYNELMTEEEVEKKLSHLTDEEFERALNTPKPPTVERTLVSITAKSFNRLQDLHDSLSDLSSKVYHEKGMLVYSFDPKLAPVAKQLIETQRKSGPEFTDCWGTGEERIEEE